MSSVFAPGGDQRAICAGIRQPAHCVIRMPLVARRTTSTWQGAGCQCRRRALGLPRGVVAAGDDVKGTGSSSSVAGDVVLLLGSSVVDNVLGVLSFFLFPFVDVHRSDKPCIIVLQVVTLSGLRFSPLTKSFRSSSHLLAGLPALH